MNAKLVLGGAVAGAAIMYFADPKSGKSRRALLRDKTVSCVDSSVAMAERNMRDLKNRWTGLMATMSPSSPELVVSDELLAQRVHSALGHVVSHPKAVEVIVKDGYVTVYGPILTAEVPNLVQRVRSIPGVRGVINRLESQKKAGNEPALQGGRRQTRRLAFTGTIESPTSRLMALVAGWALTFLGLKRRSLPGTAAALAGMAMSWRSLATGSMDREMKLSKAA
jgi:gas vesicle protein